MKIKKLAGIMLCTVILATAISNAGMSVSGITQGNDYIYDDYGQSVASPAAFTVSRIIKGEDIGIGGFEEPEDLFVDKQNRLYICDSGNNRVIILDSDFGLIKIIDKVKVDGEWQSLKKPTGVFSVDGKEIYICDYGNQRSIKIDESCTVTAQYLKPETEALEGYDAFYPKKIVVDNAGCVYVMAHEIYQGLISYENTGEYMGFFGSNKVELTIDVLAEYVWKSIFSKEQRESMERTLPTQYSNIYIDENDFIYTSTDKTDTSLDEMKKLNALGNNIIAFSEFNALYSKNDFADVEKNYENGIQIDSKIVDVHADSAGIATLLDAQRGRLFQYDTECNLLFVYGTVGDQSGTFENPVAVEKCLDSYLVLDSEKKSITVLQYTDYATAVLEAVEKYSDGLYSEAESLWRAILEKNVNFSLAYKGIGKALLQQKEYSQAMEYAKKGNDRQTYSMALKQYRKAFLRKYFFVILVLSIAALYLLNYILKKIKIALGFNVKKVKRTYE